MNKSYFKLLVNTIFLFPPARLTDDLRKIASVGWIRIAEVWRDLGEVMSSSELQ